MKGRMIRRGVFILSLFLFLCSLPGCSLLDGQKNDEDMEITQQDRTEYHNDLKKIKETATPSQIKVRTISLYTVDEKGENLVPIQVKLNTLRVTPEILLDDIVNNLNVEIDVSSYTIENNTMFIIFGDNGVPVEGCSAEFESLVLDCFANSILDNLDYVNGVGFRTKSGNYSSDNYEFAEDEVYSSR